MARFESRFAEGPMDWRKEVETRDKEHFSLKERAISR